MCRPKLSPQQAIFETLQYSVGFRLFPIRGYLGEEESKRNFNVNLNLLCVIFIDQR